MLLSLLVLGLTGCSMFRGAEGGKLRKRSMKYLSKNIEANEVNYDWISAKGKIKFRSPSQSLSLSSNIKMQKGKLIWLTASKFGFELARVLITPEKVQILDRYNKQYIEKPFSFIESEFGLPADFAVLEKILVGNPISLDFVDQKASTEEGQYHLTANDFGFDVDYLFNGKSLFLEKIILAQAQKSLSMEMSLDNYTEINEQHFSASRSLRADAPGVGEVTVQIDLSKISFEPLSGVSFDIPDRYEKIK